MTESYTPGDEAGRNLIKHSLDETLFVEASAGTGKTTALVSRVVSLIAEGRTTVDQVAAITFTEAAAAELRNRVRQDLEKKARDEGAPADARQRCEAAAGELERGAFQTIHSFAASILRERPLEAGLPPGFDTSDEITADLEFERVWRDWLETALDSDDAAPGLTKFLRLGLPVLVSRLEDIARAFHANYDLLPARFESDCTDSGGSDLEKIAVEGPYIGHLVTFAKNGDDDPLAAHAGMVALLCADLQRDLEDDEANVRRLVRAGKLSSARGRQTDWLNHTESGVNACKLLKAKLKDVEEWRVQFLTRRTRSAIQRSPGRAASIRMRLRGG